MSIFNKIGQKHVQLAGAWAGTGAVFGGVGFVSLLYFTDWKVVLRYLPIYNTKFPPEVEEKK